ncbi:hypothetical protein PoB_007555800 [Plakobranchus ocellatus]|uniref:Uncharacterized protein n=1 Tax=Plakobranchus ocellatus TaxID=259542 RepID=A0AAV4DXR7_9GAST|nr:hypothetical protein PoB_007555800 [Plakobranchus ocellatus]
MDILRSGTLKSGEGRSGSKMTGLSPQETISFLNGVPLARVSVPLVYVPDLRPQGAIKQVQMYKCKARSSLRSGRQCLGSNYNRKVERSQGGLAIYCAIDDSLTL